MAVIDTKQYGGTIIRIHDDCMVKTKEENDAIFAELSRMATGFYQHQREQAAEQKQTTA